MYCIPDNYGARMMVEMNNEKAPGLKTKWNIFLINNDSWYCLPNFNILLIAVQYLKNRSTCICIPNAFWGYREIFSNYEKHGKDEGNSLPSSWCLVHMAMFNQKM